MWKAAWMPSPRSMESRSVVVGTPNAISFRLRRGEQHLAVRWHAKTEGLLGASSMKGSHARSWRRRLRRSRSCRS
eukprot:1850177-Prymnesium_polylepis.1